MLVGPPDIVRILFLQESFVDGVLTLACWVAFRGILGLPALLTLLGWAWAVIVVGFSDSRLPCVSCGILPDGIVTLARLVTVRMKCA